MDWAESHLQDIRQEMEHVRRLMDDSGLQVEPPAENLRKAVSNLHEAKNRIVYALNSVSHRSWHEDERRE